MQWTWLLILIFLLLLLLSLLLNRYPNVPDRSFIVLWHLLRFFCFVLKLVIAKYDLIWILLLIFDGMWVHQRRFIDDWRFYLLLLLMVKYLVLWSGFLFLDRWFSLDWGRVRFFVYLCQLNLLLLLLFLLFCPLFLSLHHDELVCCNSFVNQVEMQ